MPNNFTLSLLEQQVKKSKQALILSHRDPDEDALGAVLTMSELVRHWGGLPQISLAGIITTKINIKENLLLPQKIDIKKYQTLIILDTINPQRTGVITPSDWDQLP